MNASVADQVEFLMTKLMTKSDEAFEELIRALMETGQSHVVTIIMHAGILSTSIYHTLLKRHRERHREIAT